MSDDMGTLIADAERTLDGFMRVHHSAAIPALIGVCVEWAVRHGGVDVVKHSLTNAIQMADELEAERARAVQ